MKLLILNGPNLNLVGKRQPEIYGNESFESYIPKLSVLFPSTEFAYFQSNHEGDLIDRLHNADTQADGVILNPGGLAHTSVVLADAIRSISVPVVEVHLSNIHAREAYRHGSYSAAACRGIISGFGMDGYRLAVLHLQA